MSDLDYVTFGERAAVEASPGFRDWLQRRGQRTKRLGGPGSSIEHKPAPARGTASHRLATRRRDLDLRDMEARITPPLAASPMVSLRVASNGCFYADAVLNGYGLSMMIDTGASVCSLTAEDAARMGFRLRSSNFTKELLTQNGRIMVAPVRIGIVRIGSISMSNVEANVGRPQPCAESLIGMSFLKHLREFSMEGACLTLRG